MRNFLLSRLTGFKKKKPIIINSSFETFTPERKTDFEEWIKEYNVSKLYSQHKPVFISNKDLDSVKIEAITRAHELFADSIS